MKKHYQTILIPLIIGVFLFIVPFNLACTVPTNGMLIDGGKIYHNYDPSTHSYGHSITYSGEIILCSGSYNLPGIAGDRSGITIQDSDVILNCNNAILNGQNTNQIGILVNDVDITLKYCNMTNYNNKAIQVQKNRNTIENNYIANNRHGIIITNSDDNTIQNNIFKSNFEGISTSNSEWNFITNNEFLSQSNEAISQVSGEGTEIRDNYFKDNYKHIVSADNEIDIIDNEFYNGGIQAIWLFGESIDFNNNLLDNAQVDIESQGTTQSYPFNIQNNIFQNFNSANIALIYPSSVSKTFYIINNTFTGMNKGIIYGYYSDIETSLAIQNNLFNNVNYPILLYKDNAEITYNQFNNAKTAIKVDDGSYIIRYNNFINTKDDAIDSILNANSITATNNYWDTIYTHEIENLISGTGVTYNLILDAPYPDGTTRMSYDDLDYDGVRDSNDNCPTNSNSDQSNLDGDSYGDVCDSDADNDGYSNSVDCNDLSASCTTDCSGFKYPDSDGDGYGNPAFPHQACSAPVNFVDNNDDCDDGGSFCNLDCTTLKYYDADNDNFGNPSNTHRACDATSGYINENTDCDDTNPDINPDGIEINNNGIDENCDGSDISFSIEINTGWNLIALPGGEIVSESIDTLRNELDYSYIAQLKEDSTGWYFDLGNSVPQELNTLQNFNPQNPLWIYSNINQNYSTSATQELFTTDNYRTIQIQKGWNLLSYPSLVERDILDVVNIYKNHTEEIKYYDNEIQEWKTWKKDIPHELNEFTTLKPGIGYWIYTSLEGEIVFENGILI